MVKNDDILFDNINMESTEIDKTYGKILEYHPEKMKEYFESIGAKEDYFRDYIVASLVHYYTLGDLYTYMDYQQMADNYGIKPKRNKDSIDIVTSDYSLSARRITDLFPEDTKLLEEYLKTEEREHKCHSLSLVLSKEMKQDNRVVTSYIYGMTDKSKLFHSFIETMIDGEEYVLDSTLNAVIKKEDYYKMYHIKENDIINVVEQKDIINDCKKYSKMIIEIGERNYLVFRDEFIKELERQEKTGFAFKK